jgi:PAS domain S-box-containing protein
MQPDAREAENNSPLEALRSLLPEGAFTPAELEEIARLCRVESFPAGHALIREREPSDNCVYFLLDGSLTVNLDGRFILRLDKRGESAGEMGLISAADRAATVLIERPSRLLVMDTRGAFRTQGAGDYKFRYYFSHLFNLILSEKLRTTSDRARLYEDAILRTRDVEEQSASLQDQVQRNLAQLRLYSHLVESAQDALLIADLDGRIQHMNPALQKRFGVPPRAIQGRLVTELLGWSTDADKTWAHLRAQLEPDGWQGEALVSPPATEPIPAHCSISVVRDDQGQRLAFSVLLRDIRAEKNYQNRILLQSRQLQKAYRSLQEMDRIKSHFLTLVSHELRTPITSILAYAETIASGMAEPPQFLEFADIILQEAKHLSELVDKVLAITKLESGQMLLNFQQASLSELVRGQVAMLRSKAELRHLRLEFAGPEAGPLTVFDPDKIREAIHQILDNAVKFTEQGEIRVTLEQHGRHSLLHVKDTGKGIPEHVVRTIFRKFETDSDPEHHSTGMGLGLPLCYLIAKAHAGELNIVSRRGEGTTVTLTLPNQPAGASSEPSDPPQRFLRP